VEPIYIQILVQEGRLQQEGVLIEDLEVERKKVLARMLDEEADLLARKRLDREVIHNGNRMFIEKRKKRG
jgi:hypothetical protein